MKARYSDTFLQLQCSEVETGKLQIQGHIDWAQKIKEKERKKGWEVREKEEFTEQIFTKQVKLLVKKKINKLPKSKRATVR